MTALIALLMIVLVLTFLVLARADRRDRAKPSFTGSHRRTTR